MTHRKLSRSFAALAATGTGTHVVSLSESISNSIAFASVGTATYQVMCSFDGTTFAKFGANVTADGIVALPDGAVAVRVDCSAYTSGTPTCSVGGLLS